MARVMPAERSQPVRLLPVDARQPDSLGYDAIYQYGRSIALERDQRLATFELLAEHFYRTGSTPKSSSCPLHNKVHDEEDRRDDEPDPQQMDEDATDREDHE
jgi:hypothetical protein